MEGVRMSNDDIAAAVLECVGGFPNVTGNSLCATRLRISLFDRSVVDRNALHSINGVLGIVDRGTSGIEVVFGPNLVRGVFRSFERLIGPLARHSEEATETIRPRHNFRVQITPETPGAPEVIVTDSRPVPEPEADVLDDDTSALLEMLEQEPEVAGEAATGEEDVLPAEADETRPSTRPCLLVVNGPNVNLLGIGGESTDFQDLHELCERCAEEAGFASCLLYQSNHEGDLIDRIQDAYGAVDAIVINAAAYAYSSRALADALRMVRIPAYEVLLDHLAAEDRGTSCVQGACLGSVDDQGVEGYRTAIIELARHLGLGAF